MIFACLGCSSLLFFGRKHYINKRKTIDENRIDKENNKKLTKKVTPAINDSERLKTHSLNTATKAMKNIATEKKELLRLQQTVGKQQRIQESIMKLKNEPKRKKSLTPNSKAIRGLQRQQNSWYKNTFKDELDILNNEEGIPKPPVKKQEKLQLPDHLPPPALNTKQFKNPTYKQNINMKITNNNNKFNTRQRKKIQPGIQARVNHFSQNNKH